MKKNRLKGFSLIEILVVVTIIALLAAGAVVTYSQLTKQSRDARRKTDLEQVRAALEMYKSNSATNTYPIGDWSALPAALAGNPKYIGVMPSDPKSSFSYYYISAAGTDYTLAAQFEVGGTNCVVGQCGANCNYCLGPYGQK